MLSRQGCYKGFSSMVLKEAPGNTVFFGSYELCKQVRAALSALLSVFVLYVCTSKYVCVFCPYGLFLTR